MKNYILLQHLETTDKRQLNKNTETKSSITNFNRFINDSNYMLEYAIKLGILSNLHNRELQACYISSSEIYGCYYPNNEIVCNFDKKYEFICACGYSLVVSYSNNYYLLTIES